ncbi:probable cyclin-dependent serine/threonine-protein kinase DDB_G0292550 [Papilio machaon]|uniref:probable cyclin-dependent serine/threonine-protein kinase DDB_G0292550 n=1 Tax=Papilio machaon TaxID=76193 RepID=UPI001E665B70|nr:probable cyclin-dependent serine/threonine-protein kinase DDB_G0292550 [Papilio machaon]
MGGPLIKSLYLFVSIICASNAQNSRLLQAPHNNGHGWDIRLAVPGQPGNDYPTLATIPRTSFSCAGREPGYYADTDTNCQVFRVCTVGATYGFQSFLCPNGTLFNQAVFVCDWWMNVDCKNSDEVLRNKNDQFENLKLGPQLMKDIKNILTHPVRNPFDTNTMKSKLLVMQSYKPPSGQLFPNGALLAPPERAPSHIYIPTKAIQVALRQNEYRPPSESFAASTSNPQYIPPTFSTFSPTTVRNVEILQRQVLNTQNIQNINSQSNSSEQMISNGHAGQVQTQNRYTQSMNNFNNDQTNRQLQRYNNFRNTQRAQSNNEFNYVQTRNSYNTLQATRTFGNNAHQLRNKDKKNNISNNVSLLHPIKQQYTYETSRQPSTQLNQTQTSEKVKQSLALVFSLLTDSINKAKKYNNIIQDNVQTLTTSPPPQFQAVNNEELGRISNTISQLTASQFTNKNFNNANTASVSNTKSQYLSNKDEKLTFLKYMQNLTAQKQNNKLQSKANNKQLNPFIPDSRSNTNTDTPIYSGQLYKYPVPEVTRQIINAPNPAKSNILIQSDIDEVKSQRIVVPKNSITKNIDTSTNINANIFKTQGTINSPLRLEVPSEKPQLKPRNNILTTGTGITAQLRDKIVGTIPHPTDKNKFVTYKKDQSYYLYSNLNDGNSVTNGQAAKQSVKKFPNNNYPDLITFHFIPSENQNEKGSFQNEPQSYQLTELKPIENINNIELTDNNINEDTYSTDLANNIIRPSQKQRESINTLYDGPSSYSAPQLSIGNLISTQESQRNNFNTRVEGLEENNNFSGYLKERPVRQFTFK